VWAGWRDKDEPVLGYDYVQRLHGTLKNLLSKEVDVQVADDDTKKFVVRLSNLLAAVASAGYDPIFPVINTAFQDHYYEIVNQIAFKANIVGYAIFPGLAKGGRVWHKARVVMIGKDYADSHPVRAPIDHCRPVTSCPYVHRPA